MLCRLFVMFIVRLPPLTASERKILSKDWRAGKEDEGDQIAARITEPQMDLGKSLQPSALYLYMPGTMSYGHQVLAAVAGSSVFL